MNGWIPSQEDYDTAIIRKLETIKVTGADGNPQPIHVTYFTPPVEGEEDRDDLRPVVVVHMYDESHDLRRELSDLTEILAQTETEIELRGVPTPVRFFYQFTVITDFQLHMNEILKQLNKLFKKRGYITVTAPDGEALHYDFFQSAMSAGYEQQFLEFGANKMQRIQRRSYKYHLFAEIDDEESRVYRKVAEVTKPGVAES